MTDPRREDGVVLRDYQAAWPPRFELLAARAAAALGGLALRIEHVGSTAVPGLCAKPVIDLCVVVSPEHVGAAVGLLEAIGYAHKGDGGLPGREAFRWPIGEYRHHLYLCTPDAPAFLDHLAFRDHLRTHSDVAREYGALKRALADAHAADRGAYQAGKSAFIEDVTSAARRAGLLVQQPAGAFELIGDRAPSGVLRRLCGSQN